MPRRLILWPLGAIGLILAALAAGAVPFPASYPGLAEASGPKPYRIHVLSNGFHAAIALPADARLVHLGHGEGPDVEGADVMDALGLDPAHHRVEPDAVRHWLFGWGSRAAYTSLREVRDLTVHIAARALAFDGTVMHVQPLGALDGPHPGLYGFDVSHAQLSALVASIERSFAAREPIPDVTQGFGDRFFAGRGRFSPVATCNTWVARRLRDAGIGAGVWTPLAQTLEFGLARIAHDQAR